VYPVERGDGSERILRREEKCARLFDRLRNFRVEILGGITGTVGRYLLSGKGCSL